MTAVSEDVRLTLGSRRLPLDALDFFFFLPSVWLVCGLGLSLRLIGPAFVIVPVGFCFLYAVLRRAIPPRLLLGYVVFCILIAVASGFRLMPNSWQRHFMDEAIIRQLIPLLAYFAMAWASKAYFCRRIESGNISTGAPIIFVLNFLVLPIVLIQQNVDYQGDFSLYAKLAYFGALLNNVCIMLFFVVGAIFLSRGWRRGLAVTILLALLSITHFLHFRIFAVGVILIILGMPGRKAALLLISALVMTYIIGLNFVVELHHIAPNGGLRMSMLADAFSSILDTYGLGIGYGTESVRWVYHIPGKEDFTFLPNPESIPRERLLETLSTGMENSFIQSFLRTGIIGFSLFLAAFFVAFPHRKLPRILRDHAASLFLMSFVGCFVNSALESPNSAVGHGFVYGYLLALRTATQAAHSAKRSLNRRKAGAFLQHRLHLPAE